MPKLIVNNITKTFIPENTSHTEVIKVLDNISFSVNTGEFITIFGPNGCGKTTLLNIISGILQPDIGEIMIDSKSPGGARIGYIFQNYTESLFPWNRVVDNIALSLKLSNTPSDERQKKVKDLLRNLKITLPLDNYPYQLSGGQKQLTAIARALLFNPDLLVMDEPLSALDFETRFSMQNRIQDLWQNQHLTVLFISHEIDEAIYLADRLILLSKKPARIKNVFEVNLQRPRTHDLLESEEFFRIKAAVLHEFRDVMTR